MKKYKVLMIAVLAAIGFAFTACDKVDNAMIQREVEITGTGVENGILKLAIGESVQLKGEIHPLNTVEGTIAWTSDNEAVATVVNGKVTGVAKGEAVISAIEQGNDVCGAGQILVIVSEPSDLPVGDGTADQGTAD